ncbi:DUF427 domain-containing protein [Salibacteraceae bacterium]|jgi:uncharacterized protein (DUF427 family)|nr:DUF427 domain-containing protein [Salibacteraceae bacterium]MDC1204231.1 DUF427 domain-containing protein [Salibacteraceae bacterium]
MKQAIWKDTVIAQSDKTKNVEGNAYFPAEDINKEFFKSSETQSVCHWKGTASYYSIEVNGEVNKDAAWYYPTAKDLAKNIEGHVAFWRGVQVVDV